MSIFDAAKTDTNKNVACVSELESGTQANKNEAV